MIAEIVDNDNIANVMFNLWERWQDEKMYEDINDYGKVIAEKIQKEFPTWEVKYPSGTKKPFGVKVMVNKVYLHIFVKVKNSQYLVLCGKKL